MRHWIVLPNIGIACSLAVAASPIIIEHTSVAVGRSNVSQMLWSLPALAMRNAKQYDALVALVFRVLNVSITFFVAAILLASYQKTPMAWSPNLGAWY